MASNHSKRITTRVVEVLQLGEFAWDAQLKGFGVRCQRRAKVYVLKYRAGGRQRWATIGTHGSPWTPETARREAKRLLGQIAEGKDPAFAAVAASGGSSLPMIGKLLGHTRAATTQRYAHLAADPIRAGNDALGERIAAAMRDEGFRIGLSRGSR